MPENLSYRLLDARYIKACIDPIDFYLGELTREFSPRKLAGWVDGGLCPFHDDHAVTQ